ncbi:MAG: hypothetical protein M3N08_00780 [Pseudomonadota bacterium]|nr:hypothetical protein [Pseudomonadota bacterium]
MADFSKYTKRLAVDWDKFGQSFSKLAESSKPADGDAAAPAGNSVKPVRPDTTSSLLRVMTGSIGALGEYYFPAELIGGTCPRIAGEEEDIVWNAAAEACDTERVHVVWQSVENKIWYLAVRSSELASHVGTWCPFASLLPGMKEAAPPPVCYTHYTDETATMMAVTADSLQIYRGTTLVVRAKAERTARELGNVPVIDLVPDRILQLTPVPWYSLSLFEDRARRVLAGFAVVTALALTILSFFVWLLASMSLISTNHDLSAARARTRDKTMELMGTVEHLRTSPMREQLARFADLNDGLLAVNGFLQTYQIKDGKPRWRAILPPSVTADRINELGGKTIETTAQGVAIGNAAEVEYEAAGGTVSAKGKK